MPSTATDKTTELPQLFDVFVEVPKQLRYMGWSGRKNLPFEVIHNLEETFTITIMGPPDCDLGK